MSKGSVVMFVFQVIIFAIAWYLLRRWAKSISVPEGFEQMQLEEEVFVKLKKDKKKKLIVKIVSIYCITRSIICFLALIVSVFK